MSAPREYAHPSLCGRCGGAIPPRNPAGGATGYAMTREGMPICYPCANAQCVAEWNNTPPGERFCCYLDSDARRVTTWPGGTLATVFRVNRTHRRTPTGGTWEAWHIVARDPAGRWWHGVGQGPGMCASLTPCKGTKPPRIR